MWRALPAYGNTFAETPNLDRIAEESFAVDGCYTSYPLCQPSGPPSGRDAILMRPMSSPTDGNGPSAAYRSE